MASFAQEELFDLAQSFVPTNSGAGQALFDAVASFHTPEKQVTRGSKRTQNTPPRKPPKRRRIDPPNDPDGTSLYNLLA